jgi:hypothetical protein
MIEAGDPRLQPCEPIFWGWVPQPAYRSVAHWRKLARMAIASNGRATTAVFPPHGGKLVQWQPGQSGNPAGRSSGLKPVRDLCRQQSMDAVKALIRIVQDVDEDGRNREDGRILVVAAQTILTWAWGKPPDYNPNEERTPVSIDTSNLTADERRLLLGILRKGILKPADPPLAEAGTPEIDGG